MISFSRIWTIATATFTQLVRMKVFYFLLFFCAAVIAASLIVISASPDQELKLIKDVGFGSMSLFTIMFAIAGTAVLLPRDLEDRTLYTILTKPVRRPEYLLGKLVGVLLLVAVSLAVMQVVFSAVLYLRQSQILDRELAAIADRAVRIPATAEYAEGEADQLRSTISAQGLTPSLLLAPLSIFLKASVAAAFTLLLATFASSTLFTGICGVAVYIIGHFQSLARDYLLTGEAPALYARVLAALTALVFPDMKVFDIVDDVTAGTAIPLGAVAKMTGLALLYHRRLHRHRLLHLL